MPTLIAIAVVEHQGRFLIGRRPEGVPLAGLWEFPGGKIEPGETPEAAAVRECLEETGLAVESLFHYPTHSQDYEYGQVVLHFIACRTVTSTPAVPRTPFCWVERQSLSAYDFPEGNRELLKVLTSNTTEVV